MPPHFAGRREQLAALSNRLDILCETGASRDGLALVIGVPGVGKTQLGCKFVETATGRKDGPDVRGVEFEPEMLSGDVDMFLAMGVALGAEGAFRAIAEMDTQTVARGGGAGSFKANVAREHVRHTGEFPALLRKSAATDVWNGKALILVIDELQTVRPEGSAALRVLHQGAHGCPILPVGIGLQHLPSVLAQHGMSRTSKPIRLEPLVCHEAIEAVERGLLAMGHEVPEQSVLRLAAASHGFPQHIHEYLAGAEVAIGKYGHLEPGPALDRALEVGDQGRADYYNARLDALPSQTPSMLPVIAKMLDAGINTITEQLAVAEIDGAGFNGAETVNLAVARGVLTRTKGRISFGIPSFHAHMAAELKAHHEVEQAERLGGAEMGQRQVPEVSGKT